MTKRGHLKNAPSSSSVIGLALALAFASSAWGAPIGLGNGVCGSSRSGCDLALAQPTALPVAVRGGFTLARGTTEQPPRNVLTKSLAATIYYLALQSDYSSGTNASFLTPGGAIIRRVSSAFLNAAEIEGSARFDDGTVVNLTGANGTALRWTKVSAPFGVGVDGCELVPLRSIAVDDTVIPVPSMVFIKETVGLQLPDGSLHDGIWFAVDSGPNIVGNRVDLFAGAGEAAMARLYQQGLQHLENLTVTVLGPLRSCPK